MELKPCRRCGSGSAVLEHNDDGTWKVFCWWNYSCGCTTKNFDTEQEAIEAWNRRVGEGEKE